MRYRTAQYGRLSGRTIVCALLDVRGQLLRGWERTFAMYGFSAEVEFTKGHAKHYPACTHIVITSGEPEHETLYEEKDGVTIVDRRISLGASGTVL